MKLRCAAAVRRRRGAAARGRLARKGALIARKGALFTREGALIAREGALLLWCGVAWRRVDAQRVSRCYAVAAMGLHGTLAAHEGLVVAHALPSKQHFKRSAPAAPLAFWRQQAPR